MTTSPSPRPGAEIPPLLVVALVALGGATGALLRVGVGEVSPVSAGAFPWTTLAINLSGTAALAALPALAVVRRRPWLLPALGTGLLGGFTTLSAASAETVALLDAGRPVVAATSTLLTLGACLVVVGVVRRALPPTR